MTDRFEKSMQTLELPRVLDMLADQAVTEEGKDKARRLRPETDPVEVTALLAETTAAVEKMVLGGSPAFAGVRPVAGSLQRANMGGSLNTRELLDIAKVLAAARSAKEYGEGDAEKKTPIDVLFHALRPTGFWRIRSPAPSSGTASWPTPPARSWRPSAATCGPRRARSGIFYSASSPPPRPSICRRASSPSAPGGTSCP